MAESPSRAEEVLASTMTGMKLRWTAIFAFRRVAIEGLPLARGKFIAKKKNGILAKPAAAELDDEKVSSMAKSMAEYDEKAASRTIDAASLIFAHALLDGAAYGYCKVLMLVKPTDWMENLEKKQVSLAEMEKLPFEEVFEDRLKKFSDDLKENSSLLRKLDLIFAKCKPPSGDRKGWYRYNRDRIERITKDRNSAAHDYGPLHEIPDVMDDLNYLSGTSAYLHRLIATQYDLRIYVWDGVPHPTKEDGKWIKYSEWGKDPGGTRHAPYTIDEE